MELLDVEVARRPYRAAAYADDERHLTRALERKVEPAVEAEGVHVGVPVDLRVALGGLPEPLPVAFLDRLDANDPAGERAGGTEL